MGTRRDRPAPPPTVELAPACARAAAAGRPICLLAPPPQGTGRAAIERAAALAYLRAHGAALAHDVDAWLEAVVALVRFGMPHGPRAAIIAPPGSWLEAQALALVAEAEALGTRAPIGSSARAGTDVVLYDPALGAPPAQRRLADPGDRARASSRGERAALLRRTRRARRDRRARPRRRAHRGRPRPRAGDGVGRARDRSRAARSASSPSSSRRARVGDHETKVLLRAYGVPITRQVVATTPSAAVKRRAPRRISRRVKPWGHDLPTEPQGCPVERDVTSDALVRRAFAAVLAAAGRPPSDAGAVIVRETPPLGREVSVAFHQAAARSAGRSCSTRPARRSRRRPGAAAPARCPALAAAVVASRAGDPEPDRAGLANLLRRASHLVVDLGDRLAKLELPRVVVGGRGSRTVVVDAWCELR